MLGQAIYAVFAVLTHFDLFVPIEVDNWQKTAYFILKTRKHGKDTDGWSM